jgi:hypothetical protein
MDVPDILWLAVGVVSLVSGAVELARRRMAVNWPTTSGRVELAHARFEQNGRESYWVGELGYSYKVEGERYSGYYYKTFRSEQRASDFVAGWNGVEVPVRYRKNHPETSLLLKKDLKSALQFNAPQLAEKL